MSFYLDIAGANALIFLVRADFLPAQCLLPPLGPLAQPSSTIEPTKSTAERITSLPITNLFIFFVFTDDYLRDGFFCDGCL